jgi:hypothetical protein
VLGNAGEEEADMQVICTIWRSILLKARNLNSQGKPVIDFSKNSIDFPQSVDRISLIGKKIRLADRQGVVLCYLL